MLIKMFKNSSDARKGFSSSNDFFPSKALNSPSESKQQRFFEAQENSGNDFSKNYGKKLIIFYYSFFHNVFFTI
jgi:hypothetical protein